MALTQPQLWVARNLQHARTAAASGVTTHASLHWRTRTAALSLTAVAQFPWNASLTPSDFYAAYAAAAFGAPAGPALGALLTRWDGAALPRPVHCDPGCIRPSLPACQGSSMAAYEALVGQWEAARPSVAASGSAAALERYEYWGAQWDALRGSARVSCAWGRYEAALAGIAAMPAGSPEQRVRAVEQGFPAFAALAGNVSALMWASARAVGSYGDLGVLLQLYSSANASAGGGALGVLEGYAGGAACGAPCAAPGGSDPSAPPLLRVLTARSMLQKGEPLNLRAHLVGGCSSSSSSSSSGSSCVALVAPLGSGGEWGAVPLAAEGGEGKAVYAASIAVAPSSWDSGLQWVINCTCAGQTLLYPPAAEPPQTVIFF
jgi:hypothetical protein